MAALNADQVVGCGSALHLAQTLLRRGLMPPQGLWLVTAGAQAVSGELRISPSQATLWGLGRTLAREHPELACRRFDLDPAAPADSVGFLAAELAGPDVEDEVALRDGTRHVPRLTRRPPTDSSMPLTLRSDATYLITGGTGGLGLAVAGRLVERSAATSRS